MGVSGKTSFVSSVVASVCIILYIAAIAFGAVQIIVSSGGRRAVAEQEFTDLADRASSAAILGFMSQPYQEVIKDALNESGTLLGAIISGSNGEYGFERQPGSVISWFGNSPRFKSGFGIPKDPYYRPLRIEGQRNVTIQVLYSVIDYDLFLGTLKNTLIIILAVLALAIFTLIIELGMKGRAPSAARPAPYQKQKPQAAPVREDPPLLDAKSGVTGIPRGPSSEPQGLYSPRGNVGWESYLHDRLASELHRCASSEQDLALINMEYKSSGADPALYPRFTEEAVAFFALRDLVFEKGKQGIAVIVPGIDIDQGFARCEEFHRRIQKKTGFAVAKPSDLVIGLSSRSGRLVEADRVILEASKALAKALEDPASPIVAFKSDPEKYREYLSRNRNA
ncbi:MAG: hypothetical protein LBS48_05440 [Treponema sp.]|jgi:hypothetical protein|nr:hypothetical protein [Treponema sp.]